MRRFSTTLWIAVGLCLTAQAAAASPNHIIICGSGGDESYRTKFAAWGHRLREALVERLEQPAESVVLLTESGSEDTTSARTSDLETIRSTLEQTSMTLGRDDDLFIYLIGHGSHLRRVSRFHIPGPDLTAEQLGRWLEPIRARRIALINAASSSAGFINALSQTDRIICTATKSVDERNATEFMEYFIQALDDGSADQNRDERISVLEACRQATALTEAFYLSKGLIATEHALLDDNGDGQGTRLVTESLSDAASNDASAEADDRRDGALAAQCFLRDFSFSPAVPRDLVERYLALLNQVEELKRKKPEMESDAYYAALETLLLEAARTHRRIRRADSPSNE